MANTNQPLDSRAFACEVHLRLLEAYGEPTWRPYYQPMDELVLTFLSQSTSDLNSGRAFAALQARYPSWQAVLDARVEELAETIRSGGLSQQKAPRIQKALRRILDERGEFDISFLADLPVDEAAQVGAEVVVVGRKVRRKINVIHGISSLVTNQQISKSTSQRVRL